MSYTAFDKFDMVLKALYVEQSNHVVVSLLCIGDIYPIILIKSLLHHYAGLIKFNRVFIWSAEHA